MGKINLGISGDLGAPTNNTSQEFVNEISDELLSQRMEKISNFLCSNNCDEELVCYVYGMGAHPKSTYRGLSKMEGVDVLWTDSMLPFFLRFLSPLIASYSGLVEIADKTKLVEVFLKLAECSMVGVYIFPLSYEREFIRLSKEIPVTKDDFGLKENIENYFIYIADADSYESKTGIYEIVSYGTKTTYAGDFFE